MVSSIPTVFADDNMQNVLISVKNRIDIPEKFSEFSSDIYYDGEETEYAFSWHTPEGADGWGYVNVNADSKGIITSFGLYDYTEAGEDGGYGKKIPKLNENEASDIAKNFFAKINPQVYGEFELIETSYSYGGYNVSFVRMANGIKTEDRAYASLNGETGEVSNFYMNYTRVSSFPELGGILDSEQAKAAFQKGNALDKIYRVFGDRKEAKIVYTLSDFNIINAFTGKKFTYAEGNTRSTDNAMGAEEAADKNAVLTEKEISVLEEIAGLMSVDEVGAKLKSIPELAIKGATVTYSRLIKRDDRYVMYMNFESEDSGFGVRVDAENARIFDFWGYRTGDGESVPADEFIQKYYPEYIPKTVVKGDRRVRVENGIEFPQNTISAYKNKEKGYITNISFCFDDDIKFANPDGIISFDEAYKAAFAASEPELKYVFKNNEAVPVYIFSFDYFNYIDAMSGSPLNFDGETQTKPENEKYEYADIDGHYAETAVKALALIGAGFEGGLYEPDKTVTQRDYAALVAQCVYDYTIYKNGVFDKEATADGCIIYGAIKKDEYYPDEPLTREKAVQILLKAMGYEKFASIEGIFKTDFADNADISPELLGYAAIASGLKIVNGSGGYFYPKENITRGQAAIIIYNYLTK